MMKATGIVQTVDELGRIVLPIELRRNLDISEHDPLEIYVEGTYIVLKKYQPACIFVGTPRNSRPSEGKIFVRVALEIWVMDSISALGYLKKPPRPILALHLVLNELRIEPSYRAGLLLKFRPENCVTTAPKFSPKI